MFELPNTNQIRLAGRITHDVELRHTNSGKAVTDVTIAVNNRKKDAQGQWIDDVPVFMTAVVWDKKASAIANLKKGTEVLVEGKLVARTYKDKDQNDRRVQEIVAHSVIVGAAPRPKPAVAAAPAATGTI